MTALKSIITINHVCDGDRNSEIRKKYTIEDMIFAGMIMELGDKVVAKVEFFDLKSDIQIN